MSVESALKEMLRELRVPSDLIINYDDMHGLWGGTSISVSGKGEAVIIDRARDGTERKRVKTGIPADRLLELVAVLAKMEAWGQRTPDRLPVPDESRASLVIRLGTDVTQMWEWFNDMQKNQRLLQIKIKMTEMLS